MKTKAGVYWDKPWNPVTGCTPCSPGCLNCWAKELAGRFPWTAHGGDNTCPTCFGRGWLGSDADAGTGRDERCGKCRGEGAIPIPFSQIVTHPDRLSQPLHWRKPRVVAVCWMGDLFHEDVPDLLLEAVFGVMSFCGQQQFLVLTKRPARMRQWLSTTSLSMCQAEATVRGDCERHPRWHHRPENDVVINSWPLPNVHLGVTACNQEEADEKVPILLDTPAAHRWVSLEPLLGEVDFAPHLSPQTKTSFYNRGGRGMSAQVIVRKEHLNWVVAGCESGPRRRPASHDLFRSLRDQCAEAGVPFYLKQMSEREDGTGRVVKAPYLDGVQHLATPWEEQ